MKICQIVGYKNAGKTTVMQQLIQYFTSSGWKVGALKHHGHGGDPTIETATDSYRHFAAGAELSAVQGEATTHLILPNRQLSDLVALYQLIKTDILLIEGFKKANYPKIVLLRNRKEVSILHELSTIIAVGTWDNEVHTGEKPVFSVPQIESCIGRLAEIITNKGC